jgi:hypothetical protein
VSSSSLPIDRVRAIFLSPLLIVSIVLASRKNTSVNLSRELKDATQGGLRILPRLIRFIKEFQTNLGLPCTTQSMQQTNMPLSNLL